MFIIHRSFYAKHANLSFLGWTLDNIGKIIQVVAMYHMFDSRVLLAVLSVVLY
jgi:hypothetical protein